jgi:predicted dehydrogenase
MARKGAQREDGVPNSEHVGAALAFIESGIRVICDKPLTTTLPNALKLKATVQQSGCIFAITYDYIG